MAGLSTFQKGLKWPKMANIPLVDRLDPFGPFLEKNNFLPQKSKVFLGQMNNKFLPEKVKKDSNGPKMIPFSHFLSEYGHFCTSPCHECRHGICQKIYTAGFSGQKFYTLNFT